MSSKLCIQVCRTTEALLTPPLNDLHFCDFRPSDPPSPPTPGAGLLVCYPLAKYMRILHVPYGAPNYPRSLSKPSPTTHYEREEKTRRG